MRMSDWSSDVCSSDLLKSFLAQNYPKAGEPAQCRNDNRRGDIGQYGASTPRSTAATRIIGCTYLHSLLFGWLCYTYQHSLLFGWLCYTYQHSLLFGWLSPTRPVLNPEPSLVGGLQRKIKPVATLLAFVVQYFCLSELTKALKQQTLSLKTRGLYFSLAEMEGFDHSVPLSTHAFHDCSIDHSDNSHGGLKK